MNKIKTLGLLALFVFSLVFPLLFSDLALTSIAVFTLILGAAATGWNIFSGYTRYIALGHAVFFGLGAYTLALVCQWWNVPGGFLPFLLLPVSGLVAGVCALPLGWIALRTRRYVFMAVTLASYALIAQAPDLLQNVIMSPVQMPVPPWDGDVFNLPFYYTALVLLLLAVGVSWWIRHSKYGLELLAIGDDEDRARGLGVKTGPSKLLAWVISAVFVGMAGGLQGYFLGFAAADSAFDRSFNIAAPLMAFLGGLGTTLGPLVGAIIAVPPQQYLTVLITTQGLSLVLYGALFLAVILALPEGIVPSLRRYWPIWMSTPLAEAVVRRLGFAFNARPAAAVQFIGPIVVQEVIVDGASTAPQPSISAQQVAGEPVELPITAKWTEKVEEQGQEDYELAYPQHATASNLNNLGEFYWACGRYAEAEALLRRALNIREQVLGPYHPGTAQSLNNLALLYKIQGRYAEAAPLYHRALFIYERALGPEHPHTKTVRANVFFLQSDTAQRMKAVGRRRKHS